MDIIRSTRKLTDPDCTQIQEKITSSQKSIDLESSDIDYELNFMDEFNISPICLTVDDSQECIQVYMSSINGAILTKIVKNHLDAFLYSNISMDCSMRLRVYRDMSRTAMESAPLFSAYNNGITTIADDIELLNKSSILRLNNWRLLNGYRTMKVLLKLFEEQYPLDSINIPVKIIIVKDSRIKEEIATNCTISANLTHSYSLSDELSNADFFRKLEIASKNIWTPNVDKKPSHKWYFMRREGQWLFELKHLKSMRKRSQHKIEYLYPNYVFDKTDLMCAELAYRMLPREASDSPKRHFVFKELLSTEYVSIKPGAVLEAIYKTIVAKLILYRSINQSVKSLYHFRKDRPVLNNYIMSSLVYLQRSEIDLSEIWNNQQINEKLQKRIEQLIPIVYEHLNIYSKEAINITWSKRIECWKTLKDNLDRL